MYESNDKMVSHPSHYQSETGLETIDVIEAFTFDLKGIEAVDTGNVLKYVCRWKQKNGLQDLEKAMWYLQHLIDHVEKLEKENAHPHKMVDLILDSKEDAEKILFEMGEIIKKYDHVTVADCYDLAGINANYRDSQYGWTNINNARIVKVTSGYSIVFPRLISFV